MCRTLLFASTIAIVMLFPLTSTGQGENNWWYFGDVAVEFNGTNPTVHFDSAMDQVEGSSSISAPEGDLLFYTDGMTVWNRNNAPMPNGEGLLGNSSSSQSALIVPQPSHCGIYYVFTVPSQDTITPLTYSIVDMSLDGGLGDLLLKNIPLQNGVTERLSATLHANGVDYWIVGQRHSDLSIFSFRLTMEGMSSEPIVSAAPPPTSGGGFFIGYLKFSPNGQKLCTTSHGPDHAYLFDFDNATGTAYDPIRWSPFFGVTPGGYGVEFSSNSSVLYLHSLASPRVLLQYDLSSNNEETILASRYVVDSIMLDEGGYVAGGALQMAPDGRIYVCNLHEPALAAVEDPDVVGAGCGYEEQAIVLSPLECQDGLPNHLSHYPRCSAQVGIQGTSRTGFVMVPNPADDHTSLSYIPQSLSRGSVRIVDPSGREVVHEPLSTDRVVLPLGDLASGVYLVLLTDGNISSQQRLVVQH